MSEQKLGSERCFISDSIASKIVTTFYDEKNPIKFNIDTIEQILGVVRSSARRAISQLYYANCITKHGLHKSRYYIITKQNSLQFSWNVANSHQEIMKRKMLKRNNKKSAINSWEKRKIKQAKMRSVKTSLLNEQCVNCRLWFNWNGLRVHRNKCFKKPLSFSDPVPETSGRYW